VTIFVVLTSCCLGKKTTRQNRILERKKGEEEYKVCTVSLNVPPTFKQRQDDSFFISAFFEEQDAVLEPYLLYVLIQGGWSYKPSSLLQ